MTLTATQPPTPGFRFDDASGRRRSRRRTETMVNLINDYLEIGPADRSQDGVDQLFEAILVWSEPTPPPALEGRAGPEAGRLYGRLHRVGQRYRQDFAIDESAFWLALAENFDPVLNRIVGPVDRLIETYQAAC